MAFAGAAEQIPVSVLRHDALKLVFAVLAVALGALGTAALAPRSRRHHHLLLYFSLVTLLYGMRLFAVTQTASYLLPGRLLEWADISITGLILLPFTLFFITLLLPAAHRARTWLGWALLVQAVAFTVAHLSPATGHQAHVLNNLLVLTAMVAIGVMLFRSRILPSPELWIVRGGLLAFVAFVIYTNAVSLEWVRGDGNIEYIGFAILLACLGYVAALRTLHHEHKLRVISSELDTAQRIQRGLLPDAASVTCARLAARYEPVAWVAGDLWDILQDDAHGLGIFIGDVAGHGVPAALTASMVKVACRAQAAFASDPALVLAGINRALAGNVGVQYITAAYLYLDFDTREVRYCAAGHPPVMQWTPESGAIQATESNGLLLGAFSFAEYTNWVAPLVPGTRWLLYTDGAYEAENAAEEEVGLARLESCILEHARLQPEQVCDAVVRQAVLWSGVSAEREQQDDITVLCLEYPHAMASSAEAGLA